MNSSFFIFSGSSLLLVAFIFRRQRKRTPFRYPTCKLSKTEIERYGRQLILPGFGTGAQEALGNSSVLVIGAGGIGSSVIPLLAGAGVGKIGIVDPDVVEVSNLHRQIMHSTANVGMLKVESAKLRALAVNPLIEVVTYEIAINAANAVDLIQEYDVVVDATDNAAARYTINDACFFAKRALVSGSAVGIEGQVALYLPEGNGCYRCTFPNPPQASARGNCSDSGVLGPLPAIVGSLQAMEAIKLCSNRFAPLSDKLLQIDGRTLDFHTIKLPKTRKKHCDLCGPNPTIKTLEETAVFCRDKCLEQCTTDTLDASYEAINCPEYVAKFVTSGRKHLLLDVRQPVQAAICSLPGSFNIPFDQLESRVQELQLKLNKLKEYSGDIIPIVVFCRRGIFSREAARVLQYKCRFHRVLNLQGGLLAWTETVDPNFPLY